MDLEGFPPNTSRKKGPGRPRKNLTTVQDSENPMINGEEHNDTSMNRERRHGMARSTIKNNDKNTGRNSTERDRKNDNIANEALPTTSRSKSVHSTAHAGRIDVEVTSCNKSRRFVTITVIETTETSSQSKRPPHLKRVKPEVFHRNNHKERNAYGKKPQCGTVDYIRIWKELPCKSGIERFNNLLGDEVTMDYFEETGFTEPFIVKENLLSTGLKVPAAAFGYKNVLEAIGGDFQVSAIDVGRQNNDLSISMDELIKHFEIPPKYGSSVLNVLSLEFSNTALNAEVSAPSVVDKLDWAVQFKPPEITTSCRKFCLLTSEGSYTDWHIDFGGTNVWYYIHKGKKIFQLIPPTEDNLDKYKDWNLNPARDEIHFGKIIVPYEVHLNEGDLFFMPSGWMHAVYTPIDSIVYGGNFLDSLHVPMQFRIATLEIVMKAEDRFRYPAFYRLSWCALRKMVDDLTSPSLYKFSTLYRAIQSLVDEFWKIYLHKPGLLTAAKQEFVASVREIHQELKRIEDVLETQRVLIDSPLIGDPCPNDGFGGFTIMVRYIGCSFDSGRLKSLFSKWSTVKDVVVEQHDMAKCAFVTLETVEQCIAVATAFDRKTIDDTHMRITWAIPQSSCALDGRTCCQSRERKHETTVCLGSSHSTVTTWLSKSSSDATPGIASTTSMESISGPNSNLSHVSSKSSSVGSEWEDRPVGVSVSATFDVHSKVGYAVSLEASSNPTSLAQQNQSIRGTPFLVAKYGCFKMKVIAVRPTITVETIKSIIERGIQEDCVFKIGFYDQHTNNRTVFIYMKSVQLCEQAAACLSNSDNRSSIFLPRSSQKHPTDLFTYVQERDDEEFSLSNQQTRKRRTVKRSLFWSKRRLSGNGQSNENADRGQNTICDVQIP